MQALQRITLIKKITKNCSYKKILQRIAPIKTTKKKNNMMHGAKYMSRLR
jgi:hypothetical protein